MCKCKMNLYIIVCIVCFIIFAMQAECRRKGKTLLFPPTSPTRTQLVYGIGIPLPLEYESMTTGYVLKAEYFLPTTAEEWRPVKMKPQSVNKRQIGSEDYHSNNTRRFKDDYDDAETMNYIENVKQKQNQNGNLGKYRWAIYGVVETLTARVGLDGRACMLRAICEAAEVPFHFSSGLLGELLHIVMSPSTSADPISKHSDNEYYHAEILGKSGAPCDKVFKECSTSLLSIFSGTHYHSPLDDSTETRQRYRLKM